MAVMSKPGDVHVPHGGETVEAWYTRTIATYAWADSVVRLGDGFLTWLLATFRARDFDTFVSRGWFVVQVLQWCSIDQSVRMAAVRAVVRLTPKDAGLRYLAVYNLFGTQGGQHAEDA